MVRIRPLDGTSLGGVAFYFPYRAKQNNTTYPSENIRITGPLQVCTRLLPVANGEGLFKLTYIFCYWSDFDKVADLSFSAILYFLSKMLFSKNTYESRSKKEVVIDFFDGFFDMQLVSRLMALSRTAEFKV